MRKVFQSVATVLLAVVCQASHAQQDQYIVHSWESFEEGTIPKTLRVGHEADDKSFSVLSYITPGFPKELTAGVAQRECGRYGLLFQPRDKHLYLSVLSPTSLNRDRLGAQGRALYQMDVFLPAPGVSIPNTALLAYAPNGEKHDSFVMYRFGLSESGTRVYFAYAHNTEAPLKYEQQLVKTLKLKRPAWHRFQLIFHGSDQISCAVDGTTTSFSPITEPSIRNLTPGIMTASSAKNNFVPVLVDNLSIQWTPTDSPPPESPWTAKQEETTGTAASSFFANNPGVTWLEDPTAAWAIGQQQKRPVLVMFYSPKISPYQYLQDLDPKSPAVRDKLSKYVLVRVDANQLGGGTLAQRFQVTQIPTLLIINTSGKPERKLTIRNNKTAWPEVEEFL